MVRRSGRNRLSESGSIAIHGYQPDDFAGKPVIGIANSWSELNNCNNNLREIAEAVRRGVLLEGGLPLEFSTISLGEEFMKPSAMLYRNLMAMDVKETLRANSVDGVVLLSNCDKTTPAKLMAAASADLPAIQFNGGPRSIGHWRGTAIGSGTDLWKYSDELRAGRLSMAEWLEIEASYGCGTGACNTMGTASAMTSLSEAMGMMLPGTASIPATDSRRFQAATATGRRIVQLVGENLRPSRWQPLSSRHLRGYPRLYDDHVQQADEGCDFDFLRPTTTEALEFIQPIVGRS